MTFTQNSDFYVAVQDAGINRVIHHVMVQRPSLVNYGSILPATNPQPTCGAISTVPQVVAAHNPLITETDPLPVFQTPLKLDYIIQLIKGDMDFFPGNVFTLPPELNPPLADQQFALRANVCAGLICEPRSRIWPPIRRRKEVIDRNTDINCFCVNLFATGGCGITGLPGHQHISMNVSGIEIPELKPDGLMEMIECYALLTLNRGILPQIAQAISSVAFHTINIPDSMGSLTISAATTVPHNPAIEENQIKAFVNLDTLNLNLQMPSSGTGSTGTVTRTVRPRARTGTFDLTAAVSAGAIEEIYTAVVNGFTFTKTGSGSFGPFSASYEVSAHLEGGTLEMHDDGKILIKELDIKWDVLKITIGINIPEICIGGGQVCVLPPWPSCDVPVFGCGECVTLPSYCFFSADPDISIPIDLSGLITSEVSITAGIESFYGVGSGTPNRWQIVVVPTLPFDLDIIDIADTVGDLFENLVQGAIDDLLNSLGAPGWVIDLVDAWLGGIENILRVILDIPDDIGEWLLTMITEIGIFDSLLSDLYDYVAIQMPPVFEIEDPFTVLEQQGILIPVKIPIEFIGIGINSHEMVIDGDIGD